MMSNSDARKRAAERTHPEPRGVDVGEGRRLLAAFEATYPLSADEGDALYEWLDDNLPDLLDAAEERDRVVRRFTQLADKLEAAGTVSVYESSAEIGQLLRALLSPEDQS